MATGAGSVARRYARALFQIGVDRGTFEAFGRELDAIAGVIDGSTDLRQALANPIFRMHQRRAVLDELLPRLAPSREVQSFALLLLDRGRISILPTAARAYAEMVDVQLGRVRATITAARVLDGATAQRLKEVLAQRTGKQVIATFAVDPELIGGIVAKVGDLVLDGSLRARLESLRQKVLH